jgi:uncharacterized membrane protein
LVTVPIGSWTASLIFDIASHLVSKPAFLTQGSRWLIVIGIVGAAVASVVGSVDLASIPTGTTAFRVACFHMALSITVTCAYVVNIGWRILAPEQGGPVAQGALVLSGASVGALVLSAFLGGRLAYRYGVGVALQAAQPGGFRTDRPGA